MKTRLHIETSHQLPTALIVGNQNQLGLHLANELLAKGIAAHLFPAGGHPSDESLLTQLSTNQNFSLLSSLEPSSIPVPNYLFFIYDHSKDSLKFFKSIISTDTLSSAKINLISTPPNPSQPKQLSRLGKAHSLIKKSLTRHKNARVCHLNNLIGPFVTPNLHEPVSQALNLLQQAKLSFPTDHSQKIYPLFISDAARGVVKSIFTSNSSGKIFELAGDPITLLNFILKLRSALQPQPQPAEQFGYTSTSQQLADQIDQTKHQLGWQPQVQLDSAISQTLPWLMQNKGKAPAPVNNIQPPPNYQATGQDLLPPKPTLNQPSTQPVQPSFVPSENLAPLVISSPIQKQGELPPHNPPQLDSEQGSQLTLSPKQFIIKAQNSLPQKLQPSRKLSRSQPAQSLDQSQPPSPTPPTLPRRFSLSKPKLPILNFISSLNSKIALVLAILFIILITPPALLASNLYQVNSSLNNLRSSIENQDLGQTRLHALSAQNHLDSLEAKITFLQPLLSLVAGDQTTSSITALVSIASSVASSAQDSVTAAESVTTLINQIISPTSDNLPQLIKSADTDLLRAYHQLSTLQAQITNHPQLLSISTFQIGTNLTELNQAISIHKPNLLRANQLLAHSQSLLGFDTKKTYLILLQNSAELRPTGGFIGSYALVTVQSGKLLDIDVQDVYVADGQLRGHVEPPAAIKTYLGEPGWFLRDVNWDPNFPSTAIRAAWFLDKELGAKIDGVIGLNLQVIKSILEVTGPIDIPDYQETITADNLFERTEYQVEINQFPGSTQKQDFLGKLSDQLINQILESDQSSWVSLGSALISSADSNQLLFYSSHQPTQDTIESIGWSGSLDHPTCDQITTSDNCLTDFLAVVEANVGVNKANHFITRGLDHLVNIDPSGLVTATTTITHANSSPGENWPGGTYKNYLRLYTPPGSKLISASINNRQINPSTIDTSLEHNKTNFGFLVNTPPGETTTTKITYQLKSPLPPTNPSAYTLYLFNQSGTPADPLNFSLTFDPSLSLIDSNLDLATTSTPINTASTLDKNLQYIFEFAK